MPRTEKFVPADLRANRINMSGARCKDIRPPRLQQFLPSVPDSGYVSWIFLNTVNLAVILRHRLPKIHIGIVRTQMNCIS